MQNWHRSTWKEEDWTTNYVLNGNLFFFQSFFCRQLTIGGSNQGHRVIESLQVLWKSPSPALHWRRPIALAVGSDRKATSEEEVHRESGIEDKEPRTESQGSGISSLSPWTVIYQKVRDDFSELLLHGLLVWIELEWNALRLCLRVCKCLQGSTLDVHSAHTCIMYTKL